MTTNLQETIHIMSMILIIAFLLTGAYAIGQTDKKEKITGYICMFICILMKLDFIFSILDRNEVKLYEYKY